MSYKINKLFIAAAKQKNIFTFPHFNGDILQKLEVPGADKSLARPGRKQAGKHVRDARDFNKI